MATLKNLVLENWMGYNGKYAFPFERITALMAKNGSGKTSLFNAIRFVLTGEKPEGPMVNTEHDSALVELTVDDDGEEKVFRRKIDSDAIKGTEKVVPYVNDKKVLVKAYNEEVEKTFGQPMDNLKMFTLSEVVASMSSAEFGDVVLKYVETEFRIDDIVGFYDGCTPMEEELLRDNLPEEGITISTIDEFEEFLRERRKSFKQGIIVKKANISQLPEQCPEGSKEELTEKLRELTDFVNEYRLYEVKKKAFDDAKKTLEEQQAKEKELEKKIASYTCTVPDEADKDNMQKEYDSLRESLNNNKISFEALKKSKEQLSKTLEALEKPICPISPLITCHENKTVAKAEIADAIKSNQEGMDAINKESAVILDKMKSIQAKAKEWSDNNKLYQEKAALENTLKGLKETEIKIPDEPRPVKKPEESEEDIKAQIKAFDDFEQKGILEKELENDQELLKAMESLIKAVSGKGPIRTKIVDSYLSIFESIANKTAEATSGSSVTFRFKAEDGIKVYARFSDDYLPYESLSGGERSFFIYVVMDVLSQLTGVNILILDELSVMDKETFGYFIDILKKNAGRYSNIFIAAVDYEEMKQVLVDAGINILPLP